MGWLTLADFKTDSQVVAAALVQTPSLAGNGVLQAAIDGAERVIESWGPRRAVTAEQTAALETAHLWLAEMLFVEKSPPMVALTCLPARHASTGDASLTVDPTNRSLTEQRARELVEPFLDRSLHASVGGLHFAGTEARGAGKRSTRVLTQTWPPQRPGQSISREVLETDF